jgi:hypothetical protein
LQFSKAAAGRELRGEGHRDNAAEAEEKAYVRRDVFGEGAVG